MRPRVLARSSGKGEKEETYTDVSFRQTTVLVFLNQALGATCTREEMEFTSSKRARRRESMTSVQEDKLSYP